MGDMLTRLKIGWPVWLDLNQFEVDKDLFFSNMQYLAPFHHNLLLNKYL